MQNIIFSFHSNEISLGYRIKVLINRHKNILNSVLPDGKFGKRLEGSDKITSKIKTNMRENIKTICWNDCGLHVMCMYFHQSIELIGTDTNQQRVVLFLFQ